MRNIYKFSATALLALAIGGYIGLMQSGHISSNAREGIERGYASYVHDNYFFRRGLKAHLENSKDVIQKQGLEKTIFDYIAPRVHGHGMMKIHIANDLAKEYADYSPDKSGQQEIKEKWCQFDCV